MQWNITQQSEVINMDESQNKHADWKKTDPKKCILYDYICVKFKKMQANL